MLGQKKSGEKMNKYSMWYNWLYWLCDCDSDKLSFQLVKIVRWERENNRFRNTMALIDSLKGENENR